MQAATSLYVGPGVRIEGRVTQDSRDETIFIAGVLAGDIVTQGRVVVEAEGKIEAANQIKCFELDVYGSISGSDVLLEAGILRLRQSANVAISEISLPPGGLEQSRGSVLCAKMRMEDSNEFAKDERLLMPVAAVDAEAEAEAEADAGTSVSTSAFAQDAKDAKESRPETKGAPDFSAFAQDVKTIARDDRPAPAALAALAALATPVATPIAAPVATKAADLPAGSAASSAALLSSIAVKSTDKTTSATSSADGLPSQPIPSFLVTAAQSETGGSTMLNARMDGLHQEWGKGG